jgi:hypothetical protein
MLDAGKQKEKDTRSIKIGSIKRIIFETEIKNSGLLD